MMTATDTRAEARKSLAGKWGKGALIAFCYSIVQTVLNLILKGLEGNEALYSAFSIIVIIISVPISFGLIASYMKLKRGEDVGAFDFLTLGFSNFKRAWAVVWNIFLKTLIIEIAMCISTAIFACCMFMSMFSAADNSTAIFSMVLVVSGIATLALTIWYITKILSLALSVNIAYDNENMTAKEACNKSQELMKGNRGNLFVLSLSFIGWAILSAFTLFIGLFWLIPYINVSFVCFYEEVAGVKKEEKEVVEV